MLTNRSLGVMCQAQVIFGHHTRRVAARVGRGTKPLGEQLSCARLTAEGQHGEIEFNRTAGVPDGILLKESDALAERRVARFPLNDADTPREAHDDEIRLHRVVVEIEEQLQQTGG